MKKYLMIGFVAAVAFSSCSKNDFETYSPEQIVKAEYDAKFIAEFGQPNRNQDWGFGSGTRAFTRAITPGNQHYSLTDQPANNPTAPNEPSFRGCPEKPTFNESAPAGTPEATSSTSLENGGTYIIKTGNLSNPQNFQNLTFYVQSDIEYSSQPNTSDKGTTFIIEAGKTLTFKYSISENVKIYMAPGSHLVIDNGLTFKNTMLYVGESCTVRCSNVLFGAGSTVLNESAATDAFTAAQLNIEESTLFYNNGNLKATTGIMVQKNYNNNGQAAELVNNGSLTTNRLECQAGGAMLNEEGHTTTVNGLTYLYNTNSYWENKGNYNTYDFEINSIDQVWNKCKLTVHKADNTGTFKIAGNSHTSFVLDGDVSVQTDKMDFGNNADFYMKGNSMLEVLGECHSLNANKNHGIHGLDNSIYSIFKAGSVTSVNSNNNTQNCMNYYGRVWVDTDSHFEQVLLDKSNLTEKSDQPTYYFESNVKFKFAPHNDPCPIASSITGTCHHGYTPPTSDYQGRIMAEDLTVAESTDWDFNDVVFDYKINSDGTASILLQAAGGTLPLTIGGSLAGEQVILDANGNPANGIEVHKMFGVGTSTMVNTGVGQTKPAVPFELKDKAYSGPADIVLCVQKTVNGSKQWVVIPARRGEPAGKFVTDTTTDWCDEYANIKGAWGNFTNYVQEGSGKFAGTGKNAVYFDRVTRNEPKAE